MPVYYNKEGHPITKPQWDLYQNDPKYRIIKIVRSNPSLYPKKDCLFIVEWLGLYGALFRLQRINLITSETSSKFYEFLGAALGTQAAELKEFELSSPIAKGDFGFKCPLCNSPMNLVTGPYGNFYNCSAWKHTKCPGKRGSDGSLSQKMLHMKQSLNTSKKTKKIEKEEQEKKAAMRGLEKRAHGLEID